MDPFPVLLDEKTQFELVDVGCFLLLRLIQVFMPPFPFEIF